MIDPHTGRHHGRPIGPSLRSLAGQCFRHIAHEPGITSIELARRLGKRPAQITTALTPHVITGVLRKALDDAPRCTGTNRWTLTPQGAALWANLTQEPLHP